MLRALVLMFILPSAALAHETGSKTPLLDDWKALLAGGCNLDAAHVRTPIEARILRNTPYAAAGYAFKSAELTALYGADGGWYTPDPAARPTFEPAVGQCIKALKTHEAALRKRLAWPKAKMERRVTGQHLLVLELRKNTHLMSSPLLKRETYKGSDEVTWHLIDGCGVDDAGEKMCNGPQIVCTPEKCFWAYPG